jgi:hypothetical protein
VLIDKLSLAFAHLLLILGSLLFLWHVNLPSALWTAMILSCVLVTSGIVAFLLIQRHGKLGAAIRWLVARGLGGRRLEAVTEHISKVDDALKLFYRQSPSGLIFAVFWHLVGHSTGLLQTWLFCCLTHLPVSPSAIISAACLCLWFDFLTFAVPLNLGTLEGSRVLALKAIGSDALLGMTYGVAVRIAQLFWAGYGLLTYGFLAAQTNKPPTHTREARQTAGWEDLPRTPISERVEEVLQMDREKR